MIIYNVTVNIDDSAHDDWLDWMRKEHIPDVLQTGYFTECKISRILAFEEGGKSYSIQYTCPSMNQLEEYQRDHAPRLQEEHTKRYQGKFAAFRTLRVEDIITP